MTAALGSSVTLECVADQPVLGWTINSLQLLEGSPLIQTLENQGFIESFGVTEEVPGGYRTTITFPASVRVNNTIDRVTCLAGSNDFEIYEGRIVTIVVYGEDRLCQLSVHEQRES